MKTQPLTEVPRVHTHTHTHSLVHFVHAAHSHPGVTKESTTPAWQLLVNAVQNKWNLPITHARGILANKFNNSKQTKKRKSVALKKSAKKQKKQKRNKIQVVSDTGEYSGVRNTRAHTNQTTADSDSEVSDDASGEKHSKKKKKKKKKKYKSKRPVASDTGEYARMHAHTHPRARAHTNQTTTDSEGDVSDDLIEEKKRKNVAEKQRVAEEDRQYDELRSLGDELLRMRNPPSSADSDEAASDTVIGITSNVTAVEKAQAADRDAAEGTEVSRRPTLFVPTLGVPLCRSPVPSLSGLET